MNLPGVTVGEDNPQRRDRVVPVEVFQAVTEDVVYVEQTTGSLYAETDVDVRSEVDGIVSKIFFEEGDEVERGNLLITLDDKEYRYKKLENEGKVKKAEADLDLAKKTLTRMTQLYKEGVISGQDYDVAVSDVEVKEASLETVRATLSFSVEELEDTRILAPISGIVSKKFVDVGEYVTEGSTDMLNIVDVNPVKLEFTVPAKYFSYVKTDEEVSVSIEAYPDEEFYFKRIGFKAV
ncbi:MAG: efflux RND transporter periplasmic adaptor subunit, partial [Planctomycetota bacterium]